jgi:hypothetical protein
MTGVINDIGYINTKNPSHTVLVPSVCVSYVINDTCHAVLVPSVLVYPMSSVTPVMLSWCLQC